MRPITTQPGYSEGDVDACLASESSVYADVYTISPLVGDPMRYTTAQNDVSVVPVGNPMRVTYKARSLLVSGLRAHTKIGVEVDTQAVQLEYPATLEYQARLPFAQALLQGLLDGAHITRDRFVAQNWRSPWLGGMPMFRGLVSNVDTVGRQSATVNVKSDMALLNVSMPRDLWQPNCKNRLGDTACGFDLGSAAVIGTVGSSPTASFLPWSGSSSTFTLGKVYIDNFDTVTRIRSVAVADGTGLKLVYPLDFLPVAGQMFTAYPGCAKTMAACQTFFAGNTWEQHFKGFPFVPVAETAF